MVSADSTIKVRGLSLVSRLTGDPEDDEEEEEKKKSEEDEDDEEDDGEEEEETWQVMRYG
jgi:hypothetical protein